MLRRAGTDKTDEEMIHEELSIAPRKDLANTTRLIFVSEPSLSVLSIQSVVLFRFRKNRRLASTERICGRCQMNRGNFFSALKRRRNISQSHSLLDRNRFLDRKPYFWESGVL